MALYDHQLIRETSNVFLPLGLWLNRAKSEFPKRCLKTVIALY